jgi:hypothetical protein
MKRLLAQEEAHMVRKIFMFLSAASFVAILATEGVAATCRLRSSSGTCLFWSGSVEGHIVTDSQGGVEQHPMINMLVEPTGLGAIACGNPGDKKKAASGIQTVIVDFTTDNFKFGASEAITRANIVKGVAAVDVFAFLTDGQKGALAASCPNTGWIVLDGVPCTADIQITLTNDFGTTDGAAFRCTLNSCESLQWSEAENGFERRQYECVLQ